MINHIKPFQYHDPALTLGRSTKTIAFVGNYNYTEATYCVNHFTGDMDVEFVFSPERLDSLDHDVGFSFIEYGHYGSNKAWRALRRRYGFLPDELQRYYTQLLSYMNQTYLVLNPKARLSEALPFLKVVNHSCSEYNDLYATLYPFTDFNSHDKIQRPLAPPRHQIHLQNIVNEETDVTIGRVGQCSVCHKVYYTKGPLL